MVPVAIYKAIRDEGEELGLTENRMATKILSDHYGVAVKLPKFLRRAKEAPLPECITGVPEPLGVVPEDAARRITLGVNELQDSVVSAMQGGPPVLLPPICTEHHSTMLDYGTEWYCLMGNHKEEKNA